MMIEQILLSIKKLPAFPVTIQRVIELLKDDDYSVSDVANVIKFDPAIAVNILKICNSAYFGSRQRIRTIPDAVVHLGQKQLIRAVQTAGMSQYFTAKKAYGTDAKALWKHSVAVALMSQILSRQFYRQEDGVLYTAALVHDIGKLIMGEYVEASGEQIFKLVSENGCSFLEAEEAVIGINHAELGGRIADYWNFPPELRNAIAHHHRPDLFDEGEEKNDLCPLVYLADQYCLMMGVDGGMDGLAHRGVSDVVKKYHLREVDLEKGWVLLLDELEKANDVMQMI